MRLRRLVTPRVVIVVPVLGRPRRVQPLMADVAAATPEPHRLLFVVNRRDGITARALRAAGADHFIVGGRGTYPEKINAALHRTDEPLIFTAADDLHFHPGWFPAALEQLDDGAGVVGTNDLGNPRVVAGEHSTHSLVTRAYAMDPGGAWDTPGSILHEGYRHLFCDDELVGVAQARGVYRHAAESVVEHLHPHHAKAESDATYALGSKFVRDDRATYDRRVHLWRRPPMTETP